MKTLRHENFILTWRDRGAWLPKRVLTKARRLSLHSPLHAGLGGEVWLILRVDARRIIFARVGLCACRRPRTRPNKENPSPQVTFSDFSGVSNTLTFTSFCASLMHCLSGFRRHRLNVVRLDSNAFVCHRTTVCECCRRRSTCAVCLCAGLPHNRRVSLVASATTQTNN